MKFSIIIPTYNREKGITNAIESVINQSVADWELIVVNDCSIDSTYKICNDYANSYTNIKVFHHKQNGGVSAARNTGIRHAEGDYILFLDDDDILKKDALKIINQKGIIEDEDMVVLGYRFDPLFSNRSLDSSFIYKHIIPQHIYIEIPLHYYMMPFVWNKCYKRNLIFDNNIQFDEFRRSWEDNIFLVRCLSHCKKIRLIDDILYAKGPIRFDNHLSKIFYTQMAFDFIKEYNEFYSSFHKIYNFDTASVNKRYFRIMDSLLKDIGSSSSLEDFDILLEKIILAPEIKKWLIGFEPDNEYDMKMKYIFLSNNLHDLKQQYYQQIDNK